MQEIVSTITSKGQVTIPAAVRRHLGVGTNDKITFVIEDTGEVRSSVPTTRPSTRCAGSRDRSPLLAHGRKSRDRSGGARRGGGAVAVSTPPYIDTDVIVRLLTGDDPAQAGGCSAALPGG